MVHMMERMTVSNTERMMGRTTDCKPERMLENMDYNWGRTAPVVSSGLVRVWRLYCRKYAGEHRAAYSS